MKQDLNLLLQRTIFTYSFILSIIFILKLTGLDYIGLDISNPFIVLLDNIMTNKIIFNIVCLISIMFSQHIMLSLIFKKNVFKYTLYTIIPTFLFQYFINPILYTYGLNTIADILYLFILCLVYNLINKSNALSIKRFAFIIIINMLFQLISYTTRYAYSLEYITSPSISLILNIDYIIMMWMYYKIYFLKGDVKICWDQVGFSLQKLVLLPNLLKQYLIKYLKMNKKEKFEITLNFILILIWNMFTLFIIFLIARLNDTVIECIFIVSSFWLNKTVFGKAFHLKNAAHCFIISNLTYYCLNRITTSYSISILVPISLGILLSYFTSKLNKKNEKKLYRGMTEEQLKYYFNKISDNVLDYKICKLFYVDRLSEIKVASLTNYSVENIKKRKKVINDKLKELII